VNYVGNGKGDGIIVGGLAVVACILVIARKVEWSSVLGAIQLAIIAFTFGAIQFRLNDARASLSSDLQDNPFRGLADAALNGVGLSWAWVPLVFGAAAIVLNRPIARVFV
jgi:hypothetical protein